MLPALPYEDSVKGEPTVSDGGEKTTLVTLLEFADKVSRTVSESGIVDTEPASMSNRPRGPDFGGKARCRSSIHRIDGFEEGEYVFARPGGYDAEIENECLRRSERNFAAHKVAERQKTRRS